MRGSDVEQPIGLAFRDVLGTTREQLFAIGSEDRP
jgi:hypothetical protein